jgi:hypothetical protein
MARGDGDACAASTVLMLGGQTVRPQYANADTAAGPAAPVQSWKCGCDSLAGPTVTRWIACSRFGAARWLVDGARQGPLKLRRQATLHRRMEARPLRVSGPVLRYR